MTYSISPSYTYTQTHPFISCGKIKNLEKGHIIKPLHNTYTQHTNIIYIYLYLYYLLPSFKNFIHKCVVYIHKLFTHIHTLLGGFYG